MLSGSLFRRSLLVAAIAAAAYAGWIFIARHSATVRWTKREQQAEARKSDSPELDRIYGGSAVKILQFYASEGSVTEGGKTLICYGVLNAKSVKIDPPVEGVFVALNRCVPVTPGHDTRYTLTAEGNDGTKVSESFVLGVKADAGSLPKITSFEIAGKQKDERGRTVFLISFAAQNVQTVDIEPPAFPTLHGSPNGRFYVAPEKTTTYTLTVTGKKGHKTQKELTVEVPHH
jgi:hypothetical protein